MIIHRHIHLRDLKNKKINKLLINQGMQNALINYSNKHLPHECCGLILGSIYNDSTDNLIKSECDKFYPIENVSKEKYQWDYIMNPDEYMKILKETSIFKSHSSLELATIFHTHPNNTAIPSKFDAMGAAWHTVYLIYAVKLNKFAAWFWNGYYFIRIPINDEIVNKEYVKYTNNVKESWASWNHIK